MRRGITMSTKEAERLSIIRNLIGGHTKQKCVAQQLGISVRQIRRLIRRYEQEGPEGLVHRGRGRRSNRAVTKSDRDKVASIIQERYSDFGPKLAQEKLVAKHNINYSVETVRQIMIEEKLWQPKERKLKETHPYRERRSCIGELVQLDGSPHDWFEGRADPCTLLAYIDDATSKIMDGKFAAYEGTFTFFEATEHYLMTHGKPLAFYADRHSTFKVNRQASVEEELRDRQPRTQFSRAMEELGITLILANSPQAKGRVERLFETLQDRLVKEMRLEGISGQEDGTRFLREVYIPQHNKKFAVAPHEKADLHRPLLPRDKLEKIFTVQLSRVVSKDLIVSYNKRHYQLRPPEGYRYSLRKAKVIVAEDRNGKVTIFYKDKQIPSTLSPRTATSLDTNQVVCAKSFNEGLVNITGLSAKRRF